MRFRSAHGLGLGLVAATLFAAGLLMAMTPETARPASELWWVVHDVCVTDQRLFRVPAPCVYVNLRQAWAVVKDTRARTHLLMVPTRRISGIESASLLTPNAPNYWQYAWSARRFLSRLAGRPVPREDIALLINAVAGRTQNQLHIHLDCVAPDIARSLRDHMGEIGEAWRTLPVSLGGHPVLVRRLYGEDFGDQDPFKLLAEGVPDARAHMRDQVLGAVGAVFADGRPGFVLIAHAFPPHAVDPREQILDHACKILSATMAPAV